MSEIPAVFGFIVVLLLWLGSPCTSAEGVLATTALVAATARGAWRVAPPLVSAYLARLASRQTGAYTEHMFRRLDLESFRRLGSRRHGGPVLLKDLLPSLLDELHEGYVAGGRRTPLDPVQTRTPAAEDMAPASLSRAA